MKLSILISACFMILTVSAQCLAVESGSAEAAKNRVQEYLGRLYSTVEPPVIQGDEATVKAKLLDLTCILTLVRHPTQNSAGWLVAKHDCRR